MHLTTFRSRQLLRKKFIGSVNISRGACKFTNDHTKFRVKHLSEFFEKYLSHKVTDSGHKKVVLIRHGQSEGNQKELFHGSLDFGLTAKGRKQAEHMRDQLHNYIDKFDTFTSSTMKRALETSKIILGIDTPLEKLVDSYTEKHQHVNFRVDKRFVEYNLGGMEGINVSSLTRGEQEFLDKL